MCHQPGWQQGHSVAASAADCKAAAAPWNRLVRTLWQPPLPYPPDRLHQFKVGCEAIDCHALHRQAVAVEAQRGGGGGGGGRSHHQLRPPARWSGEIPRRVWMTARRADRPPQPQTATAGRLPRLQGGRAALTRSRTTSACPRALRRAAGAPRRPGSPFARPACSQAPLSMLGSPHVRHPTLLINADGRSGRQWAAGHLPRCGRPAAQCRSGCICSP